MPVQCLPGLRTGDSIDSNAGSAAWGPAFKPGSDPRAAISIIAAAKFLAGIYEGSEPPGDKARASFGMGSAHTAGSVKAVDERMFVELFGEADAFLIVQEFAQTAFEISGARLGKGFDAFANGGSDRAEQEENENQADGDFQDPGAKHVRPPAVRRRNRFYARPNRGNAISSIKKSHCRKMANQDMHMPLRIFRS